MRLLLSLRLRLPLISAYTGLEVHLSCGRSASASSVLTERAKGWRALQNFPVHQDLVNESFIAKRGSPVQGSLVPLPGAFIYNTFIPHDARWNRDKNSKQKICVKSLFAVHL